MQAVGWQMTCCRHSQVQRTLCRDGRAQRTFSMYQTGAEDSLQTAAWCISHAQRTHYAESRALQRLRRQRPQQILYYCESYSGCQ